MSRYSLFRFMGAALATPKLSAVMSLVFVCLSIPILIFILLYNYHTTSAAIVSNLHEQVAKTRLASIENAQNLVNPVASTLRLLAAVAASDPAVFRTEQSRELLYRALTSAEQIDAIYVSFEDGYHRVVTRVDDDRRRSDPKIPPAANWHSSYIDDFSAGKNRRRHRMFFDTWPNEVGGYEAETTADIRALPHYKTAKATRSLAVGEPSINPDTGYPVISLGFPIVRDGAFVGFAGANITVDVLSRFLDRHRASPHSTTTIVERGGAIIAYPDSAKQVRMVDGRLTVARVANIADDDLREAYLRRGSADRGQLRVPLGVDREGAERFVRQVSGRFPAALGNRHPDADRRLRRRSEGREPADGRRDHGPHGSRAGLDLWCFQADFAADRKRLAVN